MEDMASQDRDVGSREGSPFLLAEKGNRSKEGDAGNALGGSDRGGFDEINEAGSKTRERSGNDVINTTKHQPREGDTRPLHDPMTQTNAHQAGGVSKYGQEMDWYHPTHSPIDIKNDPIAAIRIRWASRYMGLALVEEVQSWVYGRSFSEFKRFKGVPKDRIPDLTGNVGLQGVE